MPETLASLVRAKFPGAYDDLDDQTLEAQVVAKFPGVYDDIPRSQASEAVTAPQAPPTPDMRKALIGAAVPYLPPDVGIGVAKGVAKTAIGAADLVASGLRHVPGVRNLVPDDSTFDRAREQFATPENTQQSIGQGLEQTAEFFAPGAMLGKAKTAVKTGKGLLDALFGAGIEGASAAVIGSTQQGTAKAAVPAMAATTGGTLAFQGGAKALAPGLKWLGERVEKALVKPTTADVRDGFQAKNIFKYNLGGTLSETYDKATKALADTSAELKKYINISNQLGRKVNLLDELTAVASDLEKNSARNFGQNQSIDSAINKLLEDPLFHKISQSGEIDLATANEVKQAVGEMGAWLHDPSGRVIGADNKAMETVANALYARLKTTIEKQSIGPIKALNHKMSEIIPIRQAIIRRIPVDQRANVLNLGDLIGFSTGAYGLALLNRLVRSGQFANLANEGGQTMQRAAQAPQNAGRVIGAIQGQR